MKRSLLSLLLATACACAAAAPHDVAPDGFAQARQQFLAGVAGDGSARDASLDAFHKLAAANPGHPLLAAYEGAAMTLQGRDALMPWNKMKYSEKGANQIEKALQQLGPEHDDALFEGSPESIETRLVAASTLLALPDFMNRGASARRAVQAALASPAFQRAAPRVRAGLYGAAARAAAADKRQDEEIAFLRKAAAADPSSRDGIRAATRLKELGQ
jgi:hypothetical protein